ncbi:MAG: hypothetical protein LRS43_04505, partial [Desulfurococcales archaeon]|nr:hypothetical protein [Desulfurococcales archaeon]
MKASTGFYLLILLVFHASAYLLEPVVGGEAPIGGFVAEYWILNSTTGSRAEYRITVVDSIRGFQYICWLNGTRIELLVGKDVVKGRFLGVEYRVSFGECYKGGSGSIGSLEVTRKYLMDLASRELFLEANGGLEWAGPFPFIARVDANESSLLLLYTSNASTSIDLPRIPEVMELARNLSSLEGFLLNTSVEEGRVRAVIGTSMVYISLDPPPSRKGYVFGNLSFEPERVASGLSLLPSPERIAERLESLNLGLSLASIPLYSDSGERLPIDQPLIVAGGRVYALQPAIIRFPEELAAEVLFGDPEKAEAFLDMAVGFDSLTGLLLYLNLSILALNLGDLLFPTFDLEYFDIAESPRDLLLALASLSEKVERPVIGFEENATEEADSTGGGLEGEGGFGSTLALVLAPAIAV